MGAFFKDLALAVKKMKSETFDRLKEAIGDLIVDAEIEEAKKNEETSVASSS